jgi:hypothetical protein
VELALKCPSRRTPLYSPLVYVIRFTEKRQNLSYVCIRTRSGEVHAGGFACTATKRVLRRFNGAAAFNHLECGGSVCPELPQQRLFWNKGSIYQLDVSSLQGAGNPRCVMTTLQAICFGAMLAWTPSLVVLALLLREAPLDEFQHDPS